MYDMINYFIMAQFASINCFPPICIYLIELPSQLINNDLVPNSMIIPRTPSLLGPLKLSWVNTFRESGKIEELNITIVDISKCMMKELMKSDYVLERVTDKQINVIINYKPHNNQSRLLQKTRREKGNIYPEYV